MKNEIEQVYTISYGSKCRVLHIDHIANDATGGKQIITKALSIVIILGWGINGVTRTCIGHFLVTIVLKVSSFTWVVVRKINVDMPSRRMGICIRESQ